MSSEKKKKAGDLQKDLRALGQASAAASVPNPKAQLRKVFLRVGVVVVVMWIVALIIPGPIPKWVALALTVTAAGLGLWILRFVNKSVAIGSLLQGAGTDEGRKQALERLEKDFKSGDTQALMARAQLEMQEDPRKALETLEQIQLDKQLGPVADQVRALRGTIHLVLGETKEARSLVDKLDLGKQQDVKTRAMFATVASEAWARTGDAKKAIETLDLFNPDDPEISESRTQMWRARAFAYAANTDIKGVQRALKKLAEVNPLLPSMFVTAKKVHPLLQQEAKQMLMRSGAVPRQMVRQRA